MLTIYHWEPNANSGKPLLAATEKGVPFESVYIDMRKFEHHTPQYLAINPLGVIPAAMHDGMNLYESTAIMEYIDAAFDGPALRPRDPLGRWRMRWWMKLADEYYAPAVSMTAWSRNRSMGEHAGESRADIEKRIAAIPQKERQVSWSKAIFGTFTVQEMADSHRRVRYAARIMEEALSRGPWLSGEAYSLADMTMFCQCYGVPLREDSPVNERDTPRTMEWLRAIAERPATQAAWALGRTWKTERLAHLRRPG
jgi:GSH-dependent disulfide-bond oxidoreductase